VSDIVTAVADSLKALDLKRPIREADIRSAHWYVANMPEAAIAASLFITRENR
jgi:hypothetical protein